MQRHPLWTTLSALCGLLFGLSCAPEGEEQTVLSIEETPTPLLDADKDGYQESDGDCDDTDAAIHPDAVEGSVAASGALNGNGVDDDCDGRIDEGTLDADDDFDGYSEREGDCDDVSAQRHPGQLDGCDGTDNDCDSIVDEDALDSLEPDDTVSEAVNLGELSCTYDVVEINIHPAGDVDQIRFSVCDDRDSLDCASGCPFQVEAQLQGLPIGLDLAITLSKELESGPQLLDSISSTVTTGEFSVAFVGSQGYDDSGDFLVQVESAPGGGGVSCHDDFRLVLFGVAPAEQTTARAGAR